MKRYTADPFQYASAHHPLRMRLLFVLILVLIPLFSSAYAQIENPDSADTETAPVLFELCQAESGVWPL